MTRPLGMPAKGGDITPASPPGLPSAASWKLHLLMLVPLCLLVAIAGWRALSAEFSIYDDGIQLIENTHIRALTLENLRWMFTDTATTQRYTPLSWITWAIAAALGGVTSRTFHAMCLAVHLVNVVLVYFFLQAVLRRLPIFGQAHRTALTLSAAVATALWATHPMRAEVIGWATQVRFGEAMACAIGALLLYLRAKAASPDAPWRRPSYWASSALYIASVLFYPSAIGLVVLLPLIDLLLLRRGERPVRPILLRTLLLEPLPYLAGALLAAFMAVIARWASPAFYDTPLTLAQFPLFPRVMQAAYVFTFYLWKPFDLRHNYPFYSDLVAFDPVSPAFLFSAAIIVGVTILLVILRRRFPGTLLLWCAHLLALAPVGGYFEHPYILNDRYAYLQSTLFAVAAAYGIARLLTHPRIAPALRTLVPGALCAVTLVFAVLSRAQLRTWQTSETMLRHILASLPPGDPSPPMIYWQLGEVYYNQHRFDEALTEIDRTLAIQPTNAVALKLRLDTLMAVLQATRPQGPAALYLDIGQTADRIIAIHPDAPTFITAGLGYQGAHRFELARDRITQALRQKPEDAGLHLLLGDILYQSGARDDALRQLDEAIRLAPSLASQRESILQKWTNATQPATTPSPLPR